MKRVLVTGASGFIGKLCLPPLLQRGFDVHGVGRTLPADASSAVHWHACDLLSAPATEALLAEIQPTHLLHLAWYVEHGKYWTATENHTWVEASARLLSAFRRAGGQRFVAAGTCAELMPAGNPLLTTPYVLSKEKFKAQLQAEAAASGLQFAWGRIFFPYGGEQPPSRLLPLLIRTLEAGNVFTSSSGVDLWDFIYAQDVGSAFAALVAGEASGVFDIGCGQLHSVREVLEAAARMMGKEQLLRFVESENPLRTPAADPGLRREFGWKPEFTLEAGLAETIRFWAGK